MSWYVLQVYTGYENRIHQAISELIDKKNLQNRIFEVFVPTQEVAQIRYGKKVYSKKKLLPGYVLLEADIDEESFNLIKSIQGVSTFLGKMNDGLPTPVTQQEIDHLMGYMENSNTVDLIEHIFEIGEHVNIINGPFVTFNGVIEEIEEGKKKLKVAVSIFGRSTPVELDYSQVEKVK